MTDKDRIIVKGTFIVAALFNEGLILCADKGGVLKGYIDGKKFEKLLTDQNKLFEVSQNVLFAANGSPTKPFDVNFSAYSYNLIETVRNYFTNKNYEDTEVFWVGLRNEVDRQFGKYIVKGGHKDWSKEDLEEDNNICELIFFHIDKTATIRWKDITVDLPNPNTPRIDLHRKTGFDGLFRPFGNMSVIEPIYHRHETFKHITAIPEVSLFISKTTTPNQITLEQAHKFIRVVMQETHKAEPDVTAEHDCKVLRGKFEFCPDS